MPAIDLSSIDLKDANLEDIDPSLFAPIAGLNSKELTVKQIGSEGVDDMIVLDDLDENMILANLKTRYTRNVIYTYIGSILVAVNSFKDLPGLYDNPAYFHKKSLNECPPHIYALSEKAYASLIATGLNQSFIISGESGAGKTESMKFICRYMARLKDEINHVQANILNVNVVLEAFGNAKTVYNNNSSRFGKFTELQFDESGVLCGARVRQYLLEKSRVVRQAQSERNYHVFYYVISGAAEPDKARWGLSGKNAESFNYLRHSGCTTVANIKDNFEYMTLRNAMTMFTQTEVDSICSIVASILHLGNIMFVNDPEKDIVVDIANRPVLDTAAQIFGIQSDDLSGPLIRRSNVIRGERIFSPLTETQAKDSRDALAKAIYGQIFTFIISKVNEVICKPGNHKFIGVLDIFGFENFQKNSMEQFCINLANEQLQDFFNEHIFKLEQMEYKHEGVKLSEVNFTDNKACLDMIMDQPNGLLDILDEQSYFPKATVDSLLNRFDENYKGHPNYERDRQVKEAYCVRHYAEKVSYHASDFLEKNRDIISSDLLEAFAHSKLPLLHIILGFQKSPEAAEKPNNRARADTAKRKIPTVCHQFKASLEELMVTLRKTQPYFVRCIKPNHQQVPNNLIDQFVLKQLQYSGMLETVRIRRQGFPVRFAFQDFIERFQYLLPPTERKALAQKGKAGCADLVKLVGLQPGDYTFGKSKVFFKDKPASLLEARLAQIQAERMAKLMAEIERKKKEEEEERRKKEEEERRIAEEKRRREEEEAAEKAKRDHEKALRKQGEERKEEEEQRLKVVMKLDDAPIPSIIKEHQGHGGDGDGGASSGSDVSDSGGEDDGKVVLPPPPPSVPADYYSREEVVRRLAQNPGWMEERKLKKMLQAYQEHDNYKLKVEAIVEAKKAEEDAFMKLPPWKRELIKKQKEEEKQARKAKRREEKKAAKKAGGGKKDKGSKRLSLNPMRRTSLTPSVLSGTPPTNVPGPIVTHAGRLSPSPASSPASSPQISPGHTVSVDVRRKMRTESQFYEEEVKIEAAPAIPPGTPPREEIERKLAAKPGWQEEKELKKQLGYYKERDKWEAKNQGALAKQSEEEAKFNALPQWKREQMLKKGQGPTSLQRPSSPLARSVSVPPPSDPEPARPNPQQGLSPGLPPANTTPTASVSDLNLAQSDPNLLPPDQQQQQQQQQQMPPPQQPGPFYGGYYGGPPPPGGFPPQQQQQPFYPVQPPPPQQQQTPFFNQQYYGAPYQPPFFDPNMPPPPQQVFDPNTGMMMMMPPPQQQQQPPYYYQPYGGAPPPFQGDPAYGYGGPFHPPQGQGGSIPSIAVQDTPEAHQAAPSPAPPGSPTPIKAAAVAPSPPGSPTPSAPSGLKKPVPMQSSALLGPGQPKASTSSSSLSPTPNSFGSRKQSPGAAGAATAAGATPPASPGGEDIPAWKLALIEKKRKELGDKQLQQQMEEQAKLDAMPKWKRALAEKGKAT